MFEIGEVTAPSELPDRLDPEAIYPRPVPSFSCSGDEDWDDTPMSLANFFAVSSSIVGGINGTPLWPRPFGNVTLPTNESFSYTARSRRRKSRQMSGASIASWTTLLEG